MTSTDRGAKRDPIRTRNRIYQAARKEFGQHGYAGARIERIAKQSGYNIRLIYHHFGSKAALYRTIVEDTYTDLRKHEAKLKLEEGDPWDSLKRLLQFTMQYFADHPEAEGIIRSENESGGRVVLHSEKVGTAGGMLLARLEGIVKRGQDTGQFGHWISAPNLYLTMTALCRFHLANSLTMSAVLGRDLQDQTWRQQWTAHATQVLYRYVSSPEALEQPEPG